MVVSVWAERFMKCSRMYGRDVEGMNVHQNWKRGSNVDFVN